MAEKELKIVIGGDSSGAESALGRIGQIAAGIGLEQIIAKVADAGRQFVTSSIQAYEASEVALTQLDTVLKSTGGAVGMTKEQLVSLASELQNTTTFSDEAVLSAENLMLTFTNVGKDVFPQATKTILDMSVALGQDTKASAIQLGKALNDPILGVSALRRVGVNFTESQKDQIEVLVKSGKTLDAQKLILKELATEFGGSATAKAKTFQGQMEQLRNKIDDLQETIGRLIVEKIQPFVKALAPIIDQINKLITGQTKLNVLLGMSEGDFAKLTTVIKILGTTIGIFLLPSIIASIVQWGISTAMLIANTVATIAHSAAVAWVTIVTNIWTAAQWLLNIALNANPIGIVILAIAALAAGIIYAYTHSETFREFVNLLWEKLKGLSGWVNSTLVPNLMLIVDAFIRVVNAIQNAINKLREFMGLKGASEHGASGSYATGGIVSQGGNVLVGEFGPELVNLPGGSFVNQSASTRGMIAGNSGTTVNIYNPSVRSNDDIRQLVKQVKKALGRENELARLGAL